MPSVRPSFQPSPSLGSVRQRLAAVLEVAGWVAAIGLLEATGRLVGASDVYDVGVFVVGVLPLTLLAHWAHRRGRLPLTAQASHALLRLGKRLARRVDVRYHVALRLAPSAHALPETPLRRPLVALAVALLAVLLLGARVHEGLWHLRSLAYTPALLLLAVLWSLALVLVTLALVLQAQGMPARRLLVLWGSGLLASVLLPASALLGALLVLGLGQAWRLARRPLAPYLFCRRDEQGRLRTVPAQAFLRRLHAVSLLAIALVVALTNAGRLFEPGLGHGALAFTHGLGLVAALAGLLLVSHLGLQFSRLLSLRSIPPETPLTPTLAWLGPTPVPGDVAEATRFGWRLFTGAEHDPEEVDLLVGPAASGPTALARAPELTPGERDFRRRRRLHVVHRREFTRRLRSLVKETRAARRAGGTGFIFCPHLWLVPALLRDVRGGARPVGRPYASVFSSRLRRYLGWCLRELQVDVVYWEDAITWADLRRVFGVVFESWDQRRLPLLERHFVGVPHVRVLLHEEGGARPDTRTAALDARLRRFEAPVATGARILVVLRDRGGEPVREEAAAPSDRRPAPVAH